MSTKSGAYVCLCSVVLVDLFGVHKVSNAFGILSLFEGIASIIGPPLIGIIIHFIFWINSNTYYFDNRINSWQIIWNWNLDFCYHYYHNWCFASIFTINTNKISKQRLFSCQSTIIIMKIRFNSFVIYILI